MDAIEALVRGLPGEADRIRRLFWRDREVPDRLRGLSRLPGRDVAIPVIGPAQSGRAEEYRQLAAELLAEAAAMLKGDRK